MRPSCASWDPLRRRTARWAADHLEELKALEPDLPDLDNDRALDNWRPLLAIAETVAGDWPERGRRAALALSGHEETDGAAVQLLADLRDLFTSKRADRLKSEEVVQALSAMEERPWPEWRAGKPMSTQQLARQLAPFDVAPQTIRFADGTVRGYLLEQFHDAFARYLPAEGATGATCLETGTFQGATGDHIVAPEKQPFCSDVADVAPESREAAAGTSSGDSARRLF